MNLSKAKAEFTRFFKIQEKVLSQKARVKWIEQGETNLAFFHSVIKDKRKRLSIQKIKDQEGNWVEATSQVAEAAVNLFTNLFKAEDIEEDSSVLSVMERCVTNKDNISLTTLPDLQEVKDTVFSIDPDCAPRLDGLSGKIISIHLASCSNFFLPRYDLGLETAEHLFCKGHYAQLIWSFFAGRMGIIIKNASLRDILQRCWNCSTKSPVAAYILKIIPPINMWELWRSRCNSKYEDEKPSTGRSISLISFNIC
ncbi:uncharacterized protein LOC132609212 [Lycium barbarum]|uniref:uncharacterized protein LOC132609212 n=1 Tax=Lycium barbarum TaxID=112863 RepID=UPI00293E1A60|nr:uncharacterized protein LOC132609212 [Lycium barbarum]